MWSGLFLVFLFVVQTKSLSVLTDDRPQTSGPDGETTKTDILRQLLNQETVIRMGLDKKVHDLVKDVVEMKRNVDNMKTIIETTNRDLLDAKNEIAAIKKENSILKTDCQVQSNVTSYLYDNIRLAKNSIKQYQRTQRELSAVVASLEVFRKNMSLLDGYVEKSNVGFTVGVLSSNFPSSPNDIVLFNYVITNTGLSYSTKTGKFNAPKGGTYVFFVTAVSSYNNTLSFNIVYNGTSKVRTYSDDSAPYQTGTNLVVLVLDKGDSVWVSRGHDKLFTTFKNIPLTTFSGFLL